MAALIAVSCPGLCFERSSPSAKLAGPEAALSLADPMRRPPRWTGAISKAGPTGPTAHRDALDRFVVDHVAGALTNDKYRFRTAEVRGDLVPGSRSLGDRRGGKAVCRVLSELHVGRQNRRPQVRTLSGRVAKRLAKAEFELRHLSVSVGCQSHQTRLPPPGSFRGFVP